MQADPSFCLRNNSSENLLDRRWHALLALPWECHMLYNFTNQYLRKEFCQFILAASSRSGQSESDAEDSVIAIIVGGSMGSNLHWEVFKRCCGMSVYLRSQTSTTVV